MTASIPYDIQRNQIIFSALSHYIQRRLYHQLTTESYICCIRCYIFRPSSRSYEPFRHIQGVRQLLHTHQDYIYQRRKDSQLPDDGKDSRPKHVAANTKNIK